MAGKVIGEFTLNIISTTVTPGPGNVQTWQVNLEGPVSGEAGAGNYVGTMSIEWEPGAKNGTYSTCGATALTAGGILGGSSTGTWEDTGAGKYHYRGTGRMADGTSFTLESDADIATRTMTGKICD